MEFFSNVKYYDKNRNSYEWKKLEPTAGMAETEKWFRGTVVEVCTRKGLITSSDFLEKIRITTLSYVWTKKKKFQQIREVTNDVSDYFCIGDMVDFRVTKLKNLEACFAHVQMPSETPFLEIFGKVLSTGSKYGLIRTNIDGEQRKLKFLDQNCATPCAESLQ